MRVLVLLVLPFALLLPTVAADETDAACEEGQWWIGYRTTRDASLVVEDAARDAGAEPIVCEGEQWDGQDNVDPQAEGSCSPSVHPQEHYAAWCLGQDPNAARGDDLLNPAGARVSLGEGEAYVAANVAYVARGAVYVGTCGAGDAGLEGDPCGGAREVRTGVYARDNTPGNIVATALCFRVVGCYFPESDCTQEWYHRGAKDGHSLCQRDNTAVGVGLLLS